MDKSIKQTDELCINIQNRVIFDFLIQELQLQSQDLLVFFFRDIEFIEGSFHFSLFSFSFLKIINSFFFFLLFFQIKEHFAQIG